MASDMRKSVDAQREREQATREKISQLMVLLRGEALERILSAAKREVS